MDLDAPQNFADERFKRRRDSTKVLDSTVLLAAPPRPLKANMRVNPNRFVCERRQGLHRDARCARGRLHAAWMRRRLACQAFCGRCVLPRVEFGLCLPRVVAPKAGPAAVRTQRLMTCLCGKCLDEEKEA